MSGGNGITLVNSGTCLYEMKKIKRDFQLPAHVKNLKEGLSHLVDDTSVVSGGSWTIVLSPEQLCAVVSRIIPGSVASAYFQHSPKFSGLLTIL